MASLRRAIGGVTASCHGLLSVFGDLAEILRQRFEEPDREGGLDVLAGTRVPGG